MANKSLRAAKDAKNDEFYMSLSWKMLSFRIDEDNDISIRNTSIVRNGGGF